ncbi:MAG TPA: energy transducer TonB [Ignavibacteriaceae bacterium]
MKTKLFFLILLFIIPFGCKEEKKIEIIPAEQVYFRLDEVDEFSEVFKKDTEKIKKTIIGLEDTIKTIFNSFDENEKKNFIVDYRVLINENGKVDKVQIIKSNYPKIDRIFADAIGTINFDPQFREGKKVKYIFPWRYSYEYFSNNNNPNLIYENNVFFVAVEEMPEPIGGLYAIQSKIKYPDEAKRNGVEGKVFIQAFIDETGNVVEAKVIKDAGYGLDEAALEAVKQTKFTPGKQKGKPVKVQVSIPIVFKLQ